MTHGQDGGSALFNKTLANSTFSDDDRPQTLAYSGYRKRQLEKIAMDSMCDVSHGLPI